MSVNTCLVRARQWAQKRSRWRSIICFEDNDSRQDIARDLYEQAAQMSRDMEVAGNIVLEMIAMLPNLTRSEKIYWLQKATSYHGRHLRENKTEDVLNMVMRTNNQLVEHLEASSDDLRAAQVIETLFDSWPLMPSGCAEQLLGKAYALSKSSDSRLFVQMRIGQKFATLLGQMKRYIEAAVEFETLASLAQTDNCLKYTTQCFVLKAGLCRLANGETVLPDYINLFPTLTSELQIIYDLLECLEVAPVTTKHKIHLQNDPWIIDLLLEIKKRKESVANGENDMSCYL